MTQKEYNGWYNYETWLVSLWLSNDEATQRYWSEVADEHLRTDGKDAAYALEDRLKEEVEASMPELGACLAADLLTAALSEVSWREISENLILDAKESVEA